MTNKTKGIVLKTIHYGETSIITSVYTELFGLQSYIVKGVRQASKKSSSKQIFFHPGAILEMEAYHNPLKNLQFIKEYRWDYLYEKVFFDVARTAIAQFMIELFLNAVKQPESNPDLFFLLEENLHQADKSVDAVAANLPEYFILQLSANLGFQLQGNFSKDTPVLDLQEGVFVQQEPVNSNFVIGAIASAISEIQNINRINTLGKIKLNRQSRNEVLQSLLQFVSYHITDFKEMKSLPVLKEILA
ncbi:MAG: DNA repair protein RecO [Bacteroidetes bacterium]|nr:DNA repair protein RecO [Bacteroidota bacterium]